jgi:hypothetical protein
LSDKVVYPYIPAKTWWQLRDKFKQTLPGKVTPAYLKSLLGLGSEKSAANYLRALKQLGLTDDDGAPTPRANEWRNDSKYPEVVGAMVAECYPQELRDLYSGPDCSQEDVRDWAKDTNALGDVAASQAAAFYKLLNNPSSQPSVTVKANGDAPKRPRKVPAPKISSKMPDVAPLPVEASRVTPPSALPAVHIDLQVHIPSDANAEQIEAIFAAMAKHLLRNA